MLRLELRVLSANSPVVPRAPLGSKQVALRPPMRKGTRLGASGVGGRKQGARSPPPAFRIYAKGKDRIELGSCLDSPHRLREAL